MVAAAAAFALPQIAGYDFESGADLGNPVERAELSSAAIKAFLNLRKKWDLNEEQSRALLGGVASSTFHAWKTNPRRTLDQDTLTRISLLIGIYKVRCRTSTSASLGQTAGLRSRIVDRSSQGVHHLAYIIQRGQPGMLDVRRMLDAWRRWPVTPPLPGESIKMGCIV